MIFSYCVGLPFFLFSLFQSLSLYHKLCHVEHLLPRTRSLWHSRELQSCMLSPLSFFSLFLCQIRTIIDLDKIKRRSCGSDVIWFTVNLYLDGTKFQRKAVCFCEECLVKNSTRNGGKSNIHAVYDDVYLLLLASIFTSPSFPLRWCDFPPSSCVTSALSHRVCVRVCMSLCVSSLSMHAWSQRCFFFFDKQRWQCALVCRCVPTGMFPYMSEQFLSRLHTG